MEYCRKLKFEQEPDYRLCINFFESCMQRHEFDGRVMDFTWKQNRLSKDKEALKNSMLNVIRKKPKIQNAAEERVSIHSTSPPFIPIQVSFDNFVSPFISFRAGFLRSNNGV